MTWTNLQRPGYFGRRRDQIVAELNAKHGKEGWRLIWLVPTSPGQLSTQDPDYPEPGEYEFNSACHLLYEESYFRHLKDRPEHLNFICSFKECIDNAETNVLSGCDYSKQEAYSTHIQDIAVRNVLRRLKRSFTNENGRLLVIRSPESVGYRYSPGIIPFEWPELIEQPSKVPRWANPGAVEDFWQSNKWIQVRE